jgi:RNA recognition motif-containing protein
MIIQTALCRILVLLLEITRITRLLRNIRRFLSVAHSLITFVSNQAAQAAVDTLNGTDVNGRPIHLRIDREGEEDPDGAAGIYVGNLAWAVTDRELEEAFSRYRPYSCRVMRNMSGRSRGFAIIKFPSVQESTAAIETLNGIDLCGRKIEVR